MSDYALNIKQYIINNENLPYKDLMTLIYNIHDSYPNIDDVSNNVRGICGELAVHYTLNYYRELTGENYIILHDIILNKQNTNIWTNEIDTIIVGPTYVISLETKAYRGIIDVYDKHTIRRKDKIYTVFEQNEQHIETLYGTIGNYLPKFDDTYIFNMVALSSPCKINDTRSDKYRGKYILSDINTLIPWLSYISNKTKHKPKLDMVRIASLIDKQDKGKLISNRNEHIRRVKNAR